MHQKKRKRKEKEKALLIEFLSDKREFVQTFPFIQQFAQFAHNWMDDDDKGCVFHLLFRLSVPVDSFRVEQFGSFKEENLNSYMWFLIGCVKSARRR
jgi:hypothetical protein